MRPVLRIVILFGLGAYFLYNLASGNLSNYVNTQLAWLSIVAALLFMVLGLAGVVDLLAARRRQHDHAHDDAHHDHDHEHSRLSWLALIVAAIPLLLGVLVPSRPLGADAIGGNITNAAAAVESNALLSQNRLEWTILDWLQAFYTSDDLDSFNDQPAEIIAFTYRSQDLPDGYFLATRFMVSCCAADGVGIGMPVVWPATIAPNTWVRVRGRMQVAEFQGETQLVLHASEVDDAIGEPDDPYLYP